MSVYYPGGKNEMKEYSSRMKDHQDRKYFILNLYQMKHNINTKVNIGAIGANDAITLLLTPYKNTFEKENPDVEIPVENRIIFMDEMGKNGEMYSDTTKILSIPNITDGFTIYVKFGSPVRFNTVRDFQSTREPPPAYNTAYTAASASPPQPEPQPIYEGDGKEALLDVEKDKNLLLNVEQDKNFLLKITGNAAMFLFFIINPIMVFLIVIFASILSIVDKKSKKSKTAKLQIIIEYSLIFFIVYQLIVMIYIRKRADYNIFHWLSIALFFCLCLICLFSKNKKISFHLKWIRCVYSFVWFMLRYHIFMDKATESYPPHRTIRGYVSYFSPLPPGLF